MDMARINEEISSLNKTDCEKIHIDIMDGCFVPQITFGHLVVKVIRSLTEKILDVHLMIDNPDIHIEDYVRAGADIITIHPQTVKHPIRSLEKIKSYNIKTGVALLPSDSLTSIDYLMPYIDLILVMSVNPGFGGQVFISNQLDKIKLLRKKINNLNITLSVDGGINSSTFMNVIDYGADCLVSGSYIFNKDNLIYQDNLSNSYFLCDNVNKQRKLYYPEVLQERINILRGDNN
ncbi:MAG TPA: ribulose-phosphate 3-epimerase [Candidatus Megaira endosymbiont of Hartmannula sinica]|nr:ribulose-phosphate 3-epimerase [Candidatus Megaera endosymbiont of Hartmannula sinica]